MDEREHGIWSIQMTYLCDMITVLCSRDGMSVGASHLVEGEALWSLALISLSGKQREKNQLIRRGPLLSSGSLISLNNKVEFLF